VSPAFRAYLLLLRWHYLRMRRQILMLIVIQVALALGIVYGLSFLLPNIDGRSALFLATGAPTITLLILGLTAVPQEVVQAKLTGRAAYLGTLPVPRLAPPAAEVTFWLLAQLPGTVLALVVAAMRFDFALHPNAAVVPAIVLVALSGAAVGYGIAMATRPEVAQQASSFVSIGILLFSPINFPMDRLPRFLQLIHEVLPLKYMADLVRWGLTGQRFGDSIVLAFAVVAAWCAAGIATSWVVATRRQ
jgi:ABC-2 type transport system permease protein